MTRNADEKELAAVPPTLLGGLSACGAVILALFGFSEAFEASEVTEAIGATTAVAAADAFFGGAVIGTRFLGITGAVGLAGSAAFAFGATSAAFDVAAAVVTFAFVGLVACLGEITCWRAWVTLQALSDSMKWHRYACFGKRYQAFNVTRLLFMPCKFNRKNIMCLKFQLEMALPNPMQ